MARSNSLAELQREQGKLVERIAAQRAAFGVQFAPVGNLLQFGDRLAGTVQAARQLLQRHPWATGSLALVLALRRPRKLGRWARRGLFLWRSWRTLRTVAGSVQRQMEKML